MNYPTKLTDFANTAIEKSANAIVRRKETIDLKEATQWLDSANPSLKFRAMCVVENIHEIPKCENCGNSTTIERSYRKSFNQYCSTKCRNASRHHNKFLEDKQWLDDKRITQRLDLESIARMSNSTSSTVKKWLKIHDLPFVNYNISKPEVQIILENKEKMEELYSSRTTAQVSEQIGSSGFVVCKWLIKHNIPRKINKTSKAELELLDFIKSIYSGTVEGGNRSVLNGLEIDVFLPDLNIGFEFNGLYWHSDQHVDKLKHYDKTKLASEKGVRLFHVFSDDWELRNKVWKNRIRHLLGCSSERIGARKCEVVEVSTAEKNLFLENNHLQGKDRSKWKLGLKFEGQLVALMTFGSSRFNKKFDYELIRYCCAGGVSVVGGFTRLLSTFRKQHADSIVSYADNSYSDGGVYRNNGFVEFSSTKCGYKYTKDFDRRENRMNFTVPKLKQRFAEELKDFTNLSEKEICYLLGYSRVYDCGTTSFSLTD